jgi:5-methyltetrahydropteroyltriglutamate--homocysteine methyltransferase
VNADVYYLEFDNDRSGNFEPLRFLPKGKTVVVGVVSSKVPELENKDEVVARIHEAAKVCFKAGFGIL